MRKETYNQAEWLSEIKKDQNLEKLEDVTILPITGRRRWFSSRILQPSYTVGYYNSSTEKIVLGQPSLTLSFTGQLTDPETMSDLSISENTTSQETSDFTVPANKVWIIVKAYATNATRSSYYNYGITLAGGTKHMYGCTHTAALGNSIAQSVIGGAYRGDSGYIILGAGDTFHIEDIAFTAADTVTKGILYVEVSV